MRINNLCHLLEDGENIVVYLELPKHYYNEWKKGKIYLNIFGEKIGIGSTVEKFFIDSTNIMIMEGTLHNLGLTYDLKTNSYYDDNHGYPYFSYKAIENDLLGINCTQKDRGDYVDLIFETTTHY